MRLPHPCSCIQAKGHISKKRLVARSCSQDHLETSVYVAAPLRMFNYQIPILNLLDCSETGSLLLRSWHLPQGYLTIVKSSGKLQYCKGDVVDIGCHDLVCWSNTTLSCCCPAILYRNSFNRIYCYTRTWTPGPPGIQYCPILSPPHPPFFFFKCLLIKKPDEARRAGIARDNFRALDQKFGSNP